MKLRRLITGIALPACWPQMAWAQTTELTPRSPWALLTQALLSLAVVVAVIYLVYFGIRRLSGRQLDESAEGPMRVVQTRHLGGGRWLYLIEVEGKRIIVGGAEGQVGHIADLGPQHGVAAGGERHDEA